MAKAMANSTDIDKLPRLSTMTTGYSKPRQHCKDINGWGLHGLSCRMNASPHPWHSDIIIFRSLNHINNHHPFQP